MFLHLVSAQLKRVLPVPAFQAIRRVGTAVLTPLSFSRNGHFRSALLGRGVDQTGQPLPWYTYPAIDFLQAQDFADSRILEFGAGQSTLWWAKRAKAVTSFEGDPVWYQELKRQMPSNVDLRPAWQDLLDANYVDDGMDGMYATLGRHDLIVIDGLDRFLCAKRALFLLADKGAIILDNAEGYWGPEGTFPILDLFRSAGFLRVDFYGFAPGVLMPHCTSIFFQPGCRLFSGAHPPARPSTSTQQTQH